MEDALRNIFIPAITSLLVFSSSCGMFQRSNDAGNKKPVSREQYDQLLVKYEELSKKYEQLKDTGMSSNLASEIQSRPVPAQPGEETETVDLFAADAQAPAVSTTPIDVPAEVEAQLNLYRRGVTLKNNNPGEATKIFQQLESQGMAPVKSRAKLQIGLILLEKQQFDLALQVFEDIIQRNANSGVVLEALRHAVICSDKLGIQNKKEQYASMLNDVFATN